MSLAACTTSSSVLKDEMGATGPKISSCRIRAASGTWVSTVGG